MHIPSCDFCPLAVSTLSPWGGGQEKEVSSPSLAWDNGKAESVVASVWLGLDVRSALCSLAFHSQSSADYVQ